MKRGIVVLGLSLYFLALFSGNVFALPATPLEGGQENCLACHSNTGPWNDESKIVIDIVDPKTGESFKQDDGSFIIPVKRNDVRRVKTILGIDANVPWVPGTVAWLYVDPEQLEKAPESSPKFAPNWEVNRTYCGKKLRETVKGFEGKKVASITMSLRPLKWAKDTDIALQVLFKPMDRTLVGNYYERKVRLKVSE